MYSTSETESLLPLDVCGLHLCPPHCSCSYLKHDFKSLCLCSNYFWRPNTMSLLWKMFLSACESLWGFSTTFLCLLNFLFFTIIFQAQHPAVEHCVCLRFASLIRIILYWAHQSGTWRECGSPWRGSSEETLAKCLLLEVRGGWGVKWEPPRMQQSCWPITRLGVGEGTKCQVSKLAREGRLAWNYCQIHREMQLLEELVPKEEGRRGVE